MVCASMSSDRVRRSYWNSAGEIREMVYRNMIEFDAEEYNWRKVAEVRRSCHGVCFVLHG